MADVRYFRVEKDTALPRAFRAVRDNSGTTYDYETEGVAYDAGSYVSSNDIDPRVLERFDDGDEHLNSLLTEVGADEVGDYDDQVRVDNELVRTPEHSVEAYVLASDVEEPYLLLSDDDAVELKNAGVEETGEASRKQLEEAEAEVDSVEEEDAPSAIDFAAAKGEADKAAGKGQSVTKLAQDGVFTDKVDAEVGDESDDDKKSARRKGGAKKAAKAGKVETQPNQANVEGEVAKEDDNKDS